MLTGYPVLKVFSTVPLAQHRAVSLIRVDLRFPEYMPATIMDTDLDSAVISRFFASLKAKIQAYQRKKRRANKRVRATTLRYFWCREFGKEKGRKHYHVILLLNKDTWCSPGISPFLLRWRR